MVENLKLSEITVVRGVPPPPLVFATARGQLDLVSHECFYRLNFSRPFRCYMRCWDAS
jgi:hypothetical protein